VSYTIDILRSAEKFLDTLGRQQPADAEAIEDVIEALSDTPRPVGCRPLKGYADVWRVRVGNYRICYQIDDDRLLILVITISTRDNVYQVLRRHLGR
jgi:mRNA interferase RelE/StbE